MRKLVFEDQDIMSFIYNLLLEAVDVRVGHDMRDFNSPSFRSQMILLSHVIQIFHENFVEQIYKNETVDGR